MMHEESKQSPKLGLFYIRGPEISTSKSKLGTRSRLKDMCKNGLVNVENHLKALGHKYKIHDGCDPGVDLDTVLEELKEHAYVIQLHAHGSINKSGVHHIRTSARERVPTKYVLSSLSDINKPMHIGLFSCYSGAALDDIKVMPIGSSLVTHSSSYVASLKPLNSEEFMSSIKEFANNTFVDYAITILISSEQDSGLSIKTKNLYS